MSSEYSYTTGCVLAEAGMMLFGTRVHDTEEFREHLESDWNGGNYGLGADVVGVSVFGSERRVEQGIDRIGEEIEKSGEDMNIEDVEIDGDIVTVKTTI